MVSTLFRSAFREIRQSMGRYLAIMAITALGVGFFSGIRMSQPNMIATGADYFSASEFYDFRLLSTLGFTEEDVSSFAQSESIDIAHGAVFCDFLWNADNDNERVLVAHSLTESINEPDLLIGRMPTQGNECLGDAKIFSEDDIGKQISVSPDNSEETLELLRYDSYTLVGVVNTAMYLNRDRGTSSIGNGSLDGYVLIPETGFSFEAYHEVYLTVEHPDPAYTQAYTDQIDAIQPSLETLLDQRAQLRYDTIRGDALAEIEDGEKELRDGWNRFNREKANSEQMLTDAYAKLTAGEQDYQAAQEKLSQGKQAYEEGLTAYDANAKELQSAQEQLDANWALYYAGREEAEMALSAEKAKLEAAQAAYDQQLANYQSLVTLEGQIPVMEQQLSELENKLSDPAYQDQWEQLQTEYNQLNVELQTAKAVLSQVNLPEMKLQLDGVMQKLDQSWAAYELAEAETNAKLEENFQELQSAQSKLDAGKAQLQAAEQKLNETAQTIREGEQALTLARTELDTGWADYHAGENTAQASFAAARSKLYKGEQELVDAREQLEELEEPETYLLSRNENAGYVSFDNDTSIIQAISVVFPVFFFLVAALVCMTTMTRMVDEQRTQIGVLKALGYSPGQIMGKYLFYSGSAALIGSVIGYAVGSICLPWVIWEIYSILYGFADLKFQFDPILAVLSLLAALLCSMGATYFACAAELKCHAAQLIRPKTPKAGKRIFLEYFTPLWKRLSFLHKVTARNVFRYKSRLVMMILGIGGCTALLVTGFGLRDSIIHIADDQFQTVTQYEYTVTFQDALTPEAIDSYFESQMIDPDNALIVHNSSVEIDSAAASKSAPLIVSSTGSLDRFIDLHLEEHSIPYPKSGEAVINRALANALKVAPGDLVTLSSEQDGKLEVTVSAICDNYLDNFIVIAEETFVQQTGAAPTYKTMYLHRSTGADPYEESVYLAEDERVSSISVNQSMRDWLANTLSRLNYIVAVVVVCAAALAFIVLYNLTNINITERIREIATIKVLGFYPNEVASYVFREITVLAILGSGFGLLMGKALHAFVMMQIQLDSLYFPIRISTNSYLISFALTMVFTLLITTALRPKLRKINMTESLKSIE